LRNPEELCTSPDELASVVTAFERGSLSRSRWYHRTHLAVAFWYLSWLPDSEAKSRICRGIRHYNECQGIPNTPDSGYHETLSLFWAGVISLFLEKADSGCAKVELVNKLLVKYGGNKDLWREYYTFDLLKCEKARRSWVEPDRKSLSADDMA
jgi:hypothetical protein